MNAFSQEGRLGKFHTADGLDLLYLLRFTGTDALNALYEYKVEALSAEQNLDFDTILGTHGRVEIASRDGPIWFDGIITRAVWMGAQENGQRYDLELRPWFWLAKHRHDQRIFHEMTVVQIVKEVLERYAAAGNPHLLDKLSHSYPKLEYTVQYRESDFAFVSRLLERFGINYYFSHDNGNHAMVLIDNVDEHPEIPGQSRPFFGVDGHHQSDEEHFWEFQPERNITAGGIRLSEFNFKSPTAMMEVDYQSPANHPFGDLESYQYPGEYLRQHDGASGVAPLRTEQERTQDKRVSALGDVSSLKSGERLKLTGHHMESTMDVDYVCMQVTHSYVSDSYGSGGPSSDGYAYQGRVILQPVSAPLVPLRKTPLARVQGPQTATVVGEGEIDCDEFGRILVRFPWDIAEAISMRCRVSQNWASQGWGGMVIPRVNMEVIVEFLEGDPDKPIVTGCVYNGRNMPPHALPTEKTKSVFRTDSHESQGYNELTFDDKTGDELIYMHGQKNQEIEILNNRTKRIGQNESLTIGKGRQKAVGESESITIGKNKVETVANNVRYSIGQNQVEFYGKDQAVTVGNILKEDIAADQITTVGGHHEKTVMGNSDISVVKTLSFSADEINLNAQTITLNAGGCKVTLGSGGVQIKAMTIEAAATSIALKGMVDMQAPAPGSNQVAAMTGAVEEAQPLVKMCGYPREKDQ